MYAMFPVVCELQNPSMSAFLGGLENSGWLKHIKAIIEASVFVAKVFLPCVSLVQQELYFFWHIFSFFILFLLYK